MYSKLIRDIKTAVENSSLPTEFIVDLGAEYGEACESVNERLSRIVGLLVEGYRDEAIQLADQTPNVLDLVAQLDFPELDAWQDVLAENSLELPPAILIEGAAQVEEAYDELRQLEPLLKTHRLLALSKAPLQSRILILRKLAKRDDTNPIWIADAEMLQHARLVQIKDEYQRAKRKNDTDHLALLDKELGQPWDIPIPKNLISSVTKTSTAVARDSSREQMIDIASQLNDCLVEYDSENAIGLRDQWNELNQTARLTPDDELFIAATEPLAWLAELDQEQADEGEFDLAVRDLEKAIDEHVTVDVLDRKIYLAQKFEREIPESLIHRANHYRSSLLLATRRTTIVRVVAVAVVLISIVFATVWYLQRRSAQQQIVTARHQMTQFVTDSGFSSGRSYFDGLEAFVKSDAEVIRQYDVLVVNEDAESLRRAEFEKLIDEIDLTGSLEINLDDALKEAAELARSDKESNRVGILKNKLNSERIMRQSKRDKEFLSRLESHQDNLARLTKQNNVAAIVELKTIIDSVERLVRANRTTIDGMNAVSSSIEQNGDNIVAKAKSKIREVESANQALLKLDTLKSGLANMEAFSTSLHAFGNQFPEEQNSDGFHRTSKEKANWASFERYRLLAQKLKAEDLTKMTPERATELSEELKSTIQDLQIQRWKTSTAAMETLLDDLKVSRPSVQDLIDRLKTTFRQAIFDDIEVIQRDDEIFYLSEPRKNKKSSYKIWRPQGKTASKPVRESDIIGQAPHCALSNDILNLLTTGGENGYDQLVLDMLNLALTQTPAGQDAENLVVDELVQCDFVDQILLFAKYATPSLKAFAERERAVLRDNGVVGTDWLGADGDVTIDARNKARQLLDELRPKLAEIQIAIDEEKEKIVAAMVWTQVADFHVAGFVYHRDGAWVVDAIEDIADQVPVFCLLPVGGDTIKIEPIGHFEAGDFKTPDASAIQAGRPIYIQQANN